MAISTLCPNCKAVFRLPDNLAGRKVKCQKCEQQFTVPKAEAEPQSVPTIPAPQPKASPEEPKPKLPPIQLSGTESKPEKAPVDEAPLLEAFEDEDTQKRRRSVPPPLETSGKSKSRGRSRDGDEDDEDGEASRPRRRRRPKQDSTGVWLMVGVISAVVLLIGGGVGLTSWLIFSGGDAPRPPQPIVQLPPVGNPPIGVPPIGIPPPVGAVPQGNPFANMIAANLDGNGFYSQGNRIDFADTILQLPGDPPRKGKSYSVNLEAGKTYHFDLRSNAVDAFLYLCDSQGKLLMANDDNPLVDTLDSYIRWTASYSGQHRLFASSLNGGETGAYTLSIRREGAPVQPKIPVAGAAETNVVFDAAGRYTHTNRLELTDRRDLINRVHKIYRVPFEAGKQYTIDLVSRDFDPYLYLHTTTNQLLASDDDGGGYPNARIVHRAQQTGVHVIRASVFGGAGQGNFTLTIRRDDVPGKIEPKFNPFPKVEPKPGNVSIALPPTQTANASIRQLNLPGTSIGTALPVWASDGRSFVCSSFDGRIHRIRAADFVEDATADLGRMCTDLALSSEGIVAITGGIRVIDPQTLKTTRTIETPSFAQCAAVPGSHLGVAYLLNTPNIALVDLKQGRILSQVVQKKPNNFVSIRALALAPDGKSVLVQSIDQLHRLRVDGAQLVWEQSAPLLGKTAHQFTFSPDGTTVGCGPGTTSKLKSAASEHAKLFQASTWNPASSGLPFNARWVTYLPDGSLIAQRHDDGSLHVLSAPVGTGKDVNLGWTQGRVRLVAPQPQGAGLLVIASTTGSASGQRAYFVELKK